MMADTAQGESPAETEAVSLEDAAEAFKNYDNPVADRPRGADGKFAKAEPEEGEEEIEAEDEAEEAESEAESHDEEDEGEAAEEAQPEPADLPTSWPAEQAEAWQSLPPETQAFIRQRDGEMTAAVNAKFQEAANVRKANEAVIAEANQARQGFVEAADHVISMVQPQRPPLSMLTPGSADYNPDHYHLLNAQADQAERLISEVRQHRQEAIAQLTKEQEAQAIQEIAEVEAKARPALLKDVPELTDPAKYQGALGEIVNYAVTNGIPQTVFSDPEQAKFVTSAQIHLAWKAMQFDKMNAAKAKVTPKAPKPSAPVVRPGVTTSKSAVEATKRKKALERLDRSGSIEDAAAFFK